MGTRKQIFVLHEKYSCGKTSTIKEVFSILNEVYPSCKKIIILPEKYKKETYDKIDINEIKEIKNNEKSEIRIIMDIDGILIGIGSLGDPVGDGPRHVKINLDTFKDCNIIFCAARRHTKSGIDDDAIFNLLNKSSDEFDINYIKQKVVKDTEPQKSQRNRTVALYIISILLPRLVYEKLNSTGE
jgi:hypothetical protein